MAMRTTTTSFRIRMYQYPLLACDRIYVSTMTVLGISFWNQTTIISQTTYLIRVFPRDILGINYW